MVADSRPIAAASDRRSPALSSMAKLSVEATTWASKRSQADCGPPLINHPYTSALCILPSCSVLVASSPWADGHSAARSVPCV